VTVWGGMRVHAAKCQGTRVTLVEKFINLGEEAGPLDFLREEDRLTGGGRLLFQGGGGKGGEGPRGSFGGNRRRT